MTNSKSQQDFDPRSVEEFKGKLLADLPAVERLVMTIREFCSQKPAQPIPLPCTSCPKSEIPHKPCERLEAYLDGAYRGRLHGETTIGVNFDEVRDQKTALGQEDGDEAASKIDRGTFRNYRKVESFDAMESYKPCLHLLSHKQQEAVSLYHGERKGLKEVAEILGKWPSTVSGLLKRAKKIKAEHDAEMRRQELKLQRGLGTKSGEI